MQNFFQEGAKPGIGKERVGGRNKAAATGGGCGTGQHGKLNFEVSPGEL